MQIPITQFKSKRKGNTDWEWIIKIVAYDKAQKVLSRHTQHESTEAHESKEASNLASNLLSNEPTTTESRNAEEFESTIMITEQAAAPSITSDVDNDGSENTNNQASVRSAFSTTATPNSIHQNLITWTRNVFTKIGPYEKEIVYHKELERLLLSKGFKVAYEVRLRYKQQGKPDIIRRADLIISRPGKLGQTLIECKAKKKFLKEDYEQVIFYRQHYGISDCYLINFCHNPKVLRLRDDVFHDMPTSISSLPRQKVKRRRTKAERKAQEEALIEARGRALTQKVNTYTAAKSTPSKPTAAKSTPSKSKRRQYTIPLTIDESLKTECELMVKKREEHKNNPDLYKQCAAENIDKLQLKLDCYEVQRTRIMELEKIDKSDHTHELVAPLTNTIIYVAREVMDNVRIYHQKSTSNYSSPKPIPTYGQIYTKIRVEEGTAAPKTPAQNKEDYVNRIKSGKIPTIPGSDNHFTQNRKLYMEMNHETTVQNKRVFSHYPQPVKDVKDGKLEIQLYHNNEYELKDSDKNRIISVVGKGFAKNSDDGGFSDTDAKVAYKLLYPKGKKKGEKEKEETKVAKIIYRYKDPTTEKMMEALVGVMILNSSTRLKIHDGCVIPLTKQSRVCSVYNLVQYCILPEYRMRGWGKIVMAELGETMISLKADLIWWVGVNSKTINLPSNLTKRFNRSMFDYREVENGTTNKFRKLVVKRYFSIQVKEKSVLEGYYKDIMKH